MILQTMAETRISPFEVNQSLSELALPIRATHHSHELVDLAALIGFVAGRDCMLDAVAYMVT